jgi:hypothetical protein
LEGLGHLLLALPFLSTNYQAQFDFEQSYRPHRKECIWDFQEFFFKVASPALIGDPQVSLLIHYDLSLHLSDLGTPFPIF